MPAKLGMIRDTEERRQHPQAFWIRRDIEFSVRADSRCDRTTPGRDDESIEPMVIGCWTSRRIPGKFYFPGPDFGKAKNALFYFEKFFR